MTTEPNEIILYGRPGCPGVPPAKRILEAAGAPYIFVDIYQDAAARRRVQEINDGYESVPTLLFPDGSTLTEPGPGALRAKLAALGYELTPLASAGSYLVGMLTNPVVLLTLAVIIWAILQFFEII